MNPPIIVVTAGTPPKRKVDPDASMDTAFAQAKSDVFAQGGEADTTSETEGTLQKGECPHCSGQLILSIDKGDDASTEGDGHE